MFLVSSLMNNIESAQYILRKHGVMGSIYFRKGIAYDGPELCSMPLNCIEGEPISLILVSETEVMFIDKVIFVDGKILSHSRITRAIRYY